MAPRGHTLPQAATESAREARKSFFCELCQKGYARSNDFEAHENSYDHQHRKRLKDLRQMTKDPNAAAKARESERKANEEAGMKSIDLSSLANAGSTTGTTKKKPVFKSTLQPHNAAAIGTQPAVSTMTEAPKIQGDGAKAPDIQGGDIKAAAGTENDRNAHDNEDPDHAKANDWEEKRWDPSRLKRKRIIDPEAEAARKKRIAKGELTKSKEEYVSAWTKLKIAKENEG